MCALALELSKDQSFTILSLHVKGLSCKCFGCEKTTRNTGSASDVAS